MPNNYHKIEFLLFYELETQYITEMNNFTDEIWECGLCGRPVIAFLVLSFRMQALHYFVFFYSGSYWGGFGWIPSSHALSNRAAGNSTHLSIWNRWVHGCSRIFCKIKFFSKHYGAEAFKYIYIAGSKSCTVTNKNKGVVFLAKISCDFLVSYFSRAF